MQAHNLQSYVRKMAKDRYRPLFCTSDFYLGYLSLFKVLKKRFDGFSDIEKVKAWTICLSCLRRPDDWFGGAHTNPFDETFDDISSIKIYDLFLETPITWPQRLDKNITLNQFLNRYRIKPLPESALRSLFKLGQKNFPLFIIDFEPTPFQLLQIQIDGQRIITFKDDVEQWPTKLYGERDPLSFVLHDLIHADHFFKDKNQHQGQMGFYKLIQKIQTDSHLQLLLNDEKFRGGFEYIISDMNAHPVHLFQTLKALIDLTVSGNESQLIWNQWILTWNLPEIQRDSVQKVNTQLFSNINANHIEVMCFNETAETGLANPN